jgi:hypothetical protein
MKRKFCEVCGSGVGGKFFQNHIRSKEHKRNLLMQAEEVEGVKYIKEAFSKRLKTAIIENTNKEEFETVSIFLESIRGKILKLFLKELAE